MDERTREREVAKMSRAFKLLAKELDAPVLLVSQLNRDNEKRGKDGKPTRPKLSDLRDSGAVEADADMVIFPWWETEPPLEGRHPASLDVAKHRNGPKGSIQVDWLPEFMTFVDCEENQENPQEGLW
jgi:replicative DNA helicase